MRVFLLHSWNETGEAPPSARVRHLVWAAAELALRGGFADALEAVWPLGRLADVPESAVAWVLAQPGQVREALAVMPGKTGRTDLVSPARSGAPRPAVFVTPPHCFWERMPDDPPDLADPRDDPAGSGPMDDESTWFDPVDWLALFWSLIQRAEEYAPGAPRDAHGRFPAWASVLARHDWLDRPVADEIALRVGRRLKELATGRPAVEPPGGRKRASSSPWTLALTHDIDSVRFWTFRRLGASVFRPALEETLVASGSVAPEAEESFVRKVPRFLRRSLRAPWFRTVRSTLYPQRDPHWSFPWLRQWESGRSLRPTLFVIPERRTAFEPYDLARGDANRGLARKLLHQLRRWAEDGAEIGLHPPYDAPDFPDRLGGQRLRMESLMGSNVPIQSVRFHWLRFRAPDAWHSLARAGFAADATLGHAQREGFRSATCHPFLAVDLRTASETGIVEVPLVAMDTTLRHHRGLTPGQAFARLYTLMQACRRAGGVFTLLWHTNSFDRFEWKGWRRVFIRIVEEAVEQSATSRTISEITSAHRGAREDLVRRLFETRNPKSES